MASAAIARFGSVRAGVVASRGFRTLSPAGSTVSRASAPFAWISGKRCMSTMYAESHEYIKKEGDNGTIGITAFATKALGDIVFVELPDVGDKLEAGSAFGSVESVKAASEVYAPADGEVTEINEALVKAPGMLNEDPEGAAWFVKMKIDGELSDKLLDEAGYKAFLATQE